jgi:hypothetical protein
MPLRFEITVSPALSSFSARIDATPYFIPLNCQGHFRRSIPSGTLLPARGPESKGPVGHLLGAGELVYDDAYDLVSLRAGRAV